MKLSKTVFGLLATSAHGKWKDCVTIDTNAIANVSPDGLDCSGDTCALRCADGFTPKAPKKVKCIQEDSTWSWNKDLGTCVTCKDITGIEDEKLDVACKVNSKNQRVCNLTCPAGTLFNGKEGKTGTKLICKCNKKGVCKWKNSNNKKINGATYRGYFCQGSSDSNDDGDSGTGDSGTGDAGTGDNGTGGTGTGPATGTNDPTAPVPARCRDPNSSTGVLEHADGTGGCPPRLVNWSIANFEQLNNIGFDPNQLMGTHLDGRSYIGVGVAGESEASPIARVYQL